jgi:hypothetical protein
MSGWTQFVLGWLLGRTTRRSQPSFVSIEAILPPGANVLDVRPTGDGRVLVVYDDGEPGT